MHERSELPYDNAGGDPTDALQPGKRQIASAYSLYSSATMLVVSWGSGVHGFTLDTTLGEFVLTHPNIRIPQRGERVMS